MKHITTILFILIPGVIFAQEAPTEDYEHHRRFRVSAAIGHTYLPKNTRVGKEFVNLTSFNLDLEYWMSHKVGVGLHNDLELLHFEVRSQEEDVIIEREYPVLITFDVIYRVYKGLTIYAGPGIEFERNEDYFVSRFGMEYEIEISRGWDVHPLFFYDLRKGAYNTMTLAIGFGKRF
jgi:hypothetical protein